MARTLKELRKLIPSPPAGTGYEVLRHYGSLTQEERDILSADDMELLRVSNLWKSREHQVLPRK